MNSIISWFAENHVAANLLMLFILMAGVFTAYHIKVEVFPEVTLDVIEVRVEYRGASPDEVEDSVIRPLEERISGLPGIERITSVATEGLGKITVEVMRGWDARKLYDDIKVEVDSITTLPKEAERPIVKQVVRRYPVVNLALYGQVSEGVLKYWAERIKEELLSLPEITEVAYYALRPAEIHVEVSEETLRKYRLSLEDLARVIRASSLDLPAGRIKDPVREILLRTRGKRYYGREYADIVVLARENGAEITLQDLAQIKDEFRDILDLYAYFQGQRAAVIEVFRIGEQNVLKLSKAVRRALPEIEAELPEGLHLVVFDDNSEIVKARLFLLLKNMSLGMLLVLFLLGLFLNLRLSFWIMLGIPVSFATALWLLPYFDVSINMVSLFAFILVLGIVVDDAIVIGENVFLYREKGLPPLEASIRGTLEVAQPVIFSVLTTMAAFWPLLYGSGVLGKFIRNIPIVVILVLTGSLLESLLVLPAHLAATKGKISPEGRSFLARVLHRLVEGPYLGLLRKLLIFRYVTVAFGLAILFLVLSLWLGGRIKFTFFPRVESDDVECYLTMPAGTPAERTLAVARRIEKAGIEVVREFEKRYHRRLLEYSLLMLGVHQARHGPKAGVPTQGPHLAQVTLKLVPSEKRKGISAAAIVRAWRKRVGEIPGAEGVLFQSELFSLGKPIEVALSLKNEAELLQVVEEVKRELSRFPGVHDIEDSFLPGKAEIKLKLKPGARSLGVTLEDVSRAVRHAFYGAEALRVQRGEDEVQILVRYPERERVSVWDLEHLRLHLPGREIPLLEVADLVWGEGYVALTRLDCRRVISVLAEVDEKVASADRIRQYLQKEFLPRLKRKHPGLYFSLEGEGRRRREAMSDVFRGFFIAQILIFVLLAVPLRSYIQPLIIMFAVPFGIVGAFIGHKIMGYHLNILSFFGIVGLSGVVVNDSLILVDLINQLRSAGKPVGESVIEAARRRFRPIILTTLTTFVGLMPMIFEKSLQARVLIPMAISLGFGVLFATFITLALVPCCYLILEDIRHFLGKALGGQESL